MRALSWPFEQRLTAAPGPLPHRRHHL